MKLQTTILLSTTTKVRTREIENTILNTRGLQFQR